MIPSSPISRLLPPQQQFSKWCLQKLASKPIISANLTQLHRECKPRVRRRNNRFRLSYSLPDKCRMGRRKPGRVGHPRLHRCNIHQLSCYDHHRGSAGNWWHYIDLHGLKKWWDLQGLGDQWLAASCALLGQRRKCCLLPGWIGMLGFWLWILHAQLVKGLERDHHCSSCHRSRLDFNWRIMREF